MPSEVSVALINNDNGDLEKTRSAVKFLIAGWLNKLQ